MVGNVRTVIVKFVELTKEFNCARFYWNSAESVNGVGMIEWWSVEIYGFCDSFVVWRMHRMYQ